MKQVTVKFIQLQHCAGLPLRATKSSAGYDLYSANEAPIFIKNGTSVLVPTGIKVEIPEGYHMDILPRSGFSNKNLILIPNSPGLIDCDYRGEVLVGLFNQSGSDFRLERGIRIAQCKIQESFEITWKQVDKLSDTDRNEGGFGHTGTK